MGTVLSFRAAVTFLVAGLIWGLVMAISQDFSTMPAHAHLNLLGWVSLFLFGIYYRLHPWLEGSRSAHVQVWIWIIGTIIMAIGITLVQTGHTVGEPIAAEARSRSFWMRCFFAGWYFRANATKVSL